LISEISNTNIPVKGSGISIGLTDGINNFSIRSSPNYLFVKSNYGKNVGSATGSDYVSGNYPVTGLTTDPTKSGIVANMTATKTTVYWYIKY
jgi:hypothetical protein